MRSGVIIAGGRSTRFGDVDKSVAPLDGVPMIRRVTDQLEPVIDRLVVNCREDQVDPIDAALENSPLSPTFAVDPEPDLGPMAGIETGLRAVSTEYTAVVACDMPFVDPDFVEFLFQRAAGHDAAVVRSEDGWYQTTQAVYRAEAMAEACAAALDAGQSRIVDALFDLDFVEVSEAEVADHASLRTFENINTQEELEAAEELL